MTNIDTEGGEVWVNPAREPGSSHVFTFKADYNDLPSLLEEAATWMREAADFDVQQLWIEPCTEAEEYGVVALKIVAVETLLGDLVQELEGQGAHDLAQQIIALVREHGVKEGLRLAGLGYQ